MCTILFKTVIYRRMTNLPGPYNSPSCFSRRILLVTAGMSPAVITETLWALAQPDTPFVPTEIHCITTTIGAAQIERDLLSSGVLEDLWSEYGLDRFTQMSAPVLQVVSNRNVRLDDIKSRADNEALADLTTVLIREFTEDEDAALHVSIAGGRKTMTFLGGSVLSLFARPQDRLSHVLVDPRFETRGFFYPPKSAREIIGRDGAPVSTTEANVTLADIPFVRLRSFLKPNPVAGKISYSGVVAIAQKLVDPPQMIVDLERRELICQGIVVPFGNAERDFAMAAYLAKRILDEDDTVAGAICYEELIDPGEYEDFKGMQRRIARDVFAKDRVNEQTDPISEGTFGPYMRRINKRLHTHLAHLSRRYEISSFGRKPTTRRGFNLKPSEIELRGV